VPDQYKQIKCAKSKWRGFVVTIAADALRANKAAYGISSKHLGAAVT
jgi:hypothetical protein